MKVAVAYVYPALHQPRYYPLAQRFVNTWLQYPPQAEADLRVYVNGRVPGPSDERLFAPLSPTALHGRDNSGWDVGAFQQAAEELKCDLLLCLGACVHFHRAGWLERMVSSYVENGPGLYGTTAYLTPNWHVRTTAFWCPPELLRSYPNIVGSSRSSRYSFEHGSDSFTRHVLQLGFPCIMVTWKGVFPFEQWRNHAPGAEDILCRDQHIHV